MVDIDLSRYPVFLRLEHHRFLHNQPDGTVIALADFLTARKNFNGLLFEYKPHWLQTVIVPALCEQVKEGIYDNALPEELHDTVSDMLHHELTPAECQESITFHLPAWTNTTIKPAQLLRFLEGYKKRIDNFQLDDVSPKPFDIIVRLKGRPSGLLVAVPFTPQETALVSRRRRASARASTSRRRVASSSHSGASTMLSLTARAAAQARVHGRLVRLRSQAGVSSTTSSVASTVLSPAARSAAQDRVYGHLSLLRRHTTQCVPSLFNVLGSAASAVSTVSLMPTSNVALASAHAHARLSTRQQLLFAESLPSCVSIMVSAPAPVLATRPAPPPWWVPLVVRVSSTLTRLDFC